MSIFWDFLVCIFFPAFRLNISPYSVGMREKTDQKNSKYGHFSRSVNIDILCFCYVSISFRWLFTCWTLCWSEAALHRCYIKRCSENMQQSCRRTPILKCDLINLQSNFIETTFRYWCSPVNWLYIFKANFPKNTSGKLNCRFGHIYWILNGKFHFLRVSNHLGITHLACTQYFQRK